MSAGRLVKKTGLYFIGNLSSKIVQAAILPIYAFFVTPSDLGVFDYSQVWGNIFAPVCFLAIWEAILKFIIAETDEEKIKENVSTVLSFVVSAFAITLIIILLLSRLFNVSHLFFIAIMIISIGLAQIWQYFARALHKNTDYVVASVSGTLINFALLILLVCVLRLGVVGLVLSFVIGQFSIVTIIEFKARVFSYLDIKYISKKSLFKMLKYSVPLVLNLTSLWLLNGFGRTIITQQLGAEANGLYTFALKFGTLISTLGSVISMAMCEEVILKINDPDVDMFFSQVNTNLFKIFLSISVLIMPAIVVFYNIIGSTEYFESLNLVPIFLLNAVFNIMATNVGTVFPATGKTHLTFTTTLAGTIIMVIVSYLTIGSYGIAGVGFGQVLGSLTMLLTRWLYGIKLLNLKIKLVKILVLFGLFVLASIVSININVIYNFVLFFVLCLVIFVLNRKDVVGIYNTLKIKFKKRKE